MRRPVLMVVAAVIEREGRILIGQRKKNDRHGLKWEFPGGKVEAGETPEVCLIRELKEELGIEVAEACLAPFVFASHTLESGDHLLMPLFLCRRWSGFPQALEHSALAWVKPEMMSNYPMPPADAPLVAFLRDWL